MPTFSSYSALGTTIEAGEISAGAVTFDKLGTDLNKWELLETLTYSGDATKTTAGTLKVCSEYMIVGQLQNDGATDTDISLRINADTGANYRQLWIGGTTVTSDSGTSSIKIQNLSSYNYQTMSRIIVGGLTTAQASGTLGVAIMSGGSTTKRGLSGNWGGGNAVQLTSVTIFSGQNMSGEIKVYGR